MAEHQALAVILLVQRRQHQILQIRGCLGAGDQQSISNFPSSSTTRSGSSFISPPMEVELHTAPNR